MAEDMFFELSDMYSDIEEDHMELVYEQDCVDYDNWFREVLKNVYASFDAFASAFFIEEAAND